MICCWDRLVRGDRDLICIVKDSLLRIWFVCFACGFGLFALVCLFCVWLWFVCFGWFVCLISQGGLAC
jgi:hypothetical protein